MLDLSSSSRLTPYPALSRYLSTYPYSNWEDKFPKAEGPDHTIATWFGDRGQAINLAHQTKQVGHRNPGNDSVGLIAFPFSPIVLNIHVIYCHTFPMLELYQSGDNEQHQFSAVPRLSHTANLQYALSLSIFSLEPFCSILSLMIFLVAFCC